MARINTNIAALNSLRHLNKTEKEMAKTLERLSSGKRLNHAADGPAALVIAQKMNSQVSSIDQAMRNSETSISMIQTAEGALNEVGNILINLRQLAVGAANVGANDDQMLQANQSEVDNLLATLEQIAGNTQFGTRSLLDGSNSVSGVAVGDGIEFVSAAVDTKASPSEGYKINITQVATRAMSVATRPLEFEEALGSFVLTEGGRSVALNVADDAELKQLIEKTINATSREVDPMDEEEATRIIQQLVANKLQNIVNAAGLELDVFVYRPAEKLEERLDDVNLEDQSLEKVKGWPTELKDAVDEEVLVIRHRKYGADPTFTVTTSMDYFFDEEVEANKALPAIPGRDVEGTIGGDPELDAGAPAIGDGQYLTAAPGSDAQGLTLKYTNNTDDVLHTVFDRMDQSFQGVYVEEKDNSTLVGEDKPEMGAWSEVIPEIEGFVHVTQNALAFQVGPNEGQQVKVSIGGTRPEHLGVDVDNESMFRNLSEVSLLTPQEAQDTIAIVDAAIGQVSNLRSKLGAFQKNSLESNLSSLAVSKERLSAAKSVLQDADMAAEMSNYVKNQILLSSGTAMLAQANQMPNSVLQLLNSQG